MANTIEILIKARDQATRELQSAATAAGGLTGAFAQLAPAAGALGAVGAAIVGVGAAIFTTARAFADQVEQLGNLAARTGTTVAQMQVLERSLQNMGLGAGAATQALTFMSRSIATNDPLLAKLGITSKNSYEAVLQLGDAFAASSNTAAKTEIAFRLLGRGGAELLAGLERLRAETANVQKVFDETGATLTVGAVAELSRLDAKIDTFTTRWEAFMTRIKGAAATAVLGITDAFSQGDMARVFSFLLNPGVFVIGAFQSSAARAKEIDALDKQLKEAAKRLNEVREGADLSDQALARLATRAADAATRFAELTGQDPTKVLVDFGIASEVAARALDPLAGALDKTTTKVESLAEALKRLAALSPSVEVAGIEPKFGKGVPPLPQPIAPALGEQIVKFGQQVQDELRKVNEGLLNTANIASEAAFIITGAFDQAFQRVVADLKIFGSEANSFLQQVLSGLLNFMARIAAQLAAYGFFKLLAMIGGPIGAFFGLAATAASPFRLTSTGTDAGVGDAGRGRTLERGPAPATRMLSGAADFATRSPAITEDTLTAAFVRAIKESGMTTRRSGDTFNISALDFKNVYDSLVSPGGAQRRANDRLGELAAVA